MPSVSRFHITAYPVLGGETKDELTHVDFSAADSHGDNRTWRVDRDHLMSLFDVLQPGDAAGDIIVQLCASRTVELPGNYTAVDLVQLGFRMAPTKSSRSKTRTQQLALQRLTVLAQNLG